MLMRTPKQIINGYRAYTAHEDIGPNTTADGYAQQQVEGNARKTYDFLMPLLKDLSASTILDVGCGTGTMVQTLADNGFNAYGADLAGLQKYWAKLGCSTERLFIIDPVDLELPFDDGSIDFAFSFGAIEHVGTSDGLTDRLSNYRDIRKKWIRELFRTIRDGGHLLIGGPNRNFPVDVAPAPDTQATGIERWLSKSFRCSVHTWWGDHFLWGYGDIDEYLHGLPYEMQALSIERFLYLSRVPGLAKPIAKLYLKYLPQRLLRSGFNPWVMALIKKSGLRKPHAEGGEERA